MTTTQERKDEPLTFEKVWAAMMETDREMKEMSREADRRHEETERIMKETAEAMKETKKLVDRVTANVGGLNRSLGELIEELIVARLWEKFDAYPYNLKRAYQRVPLYDENNRALTDIDILLSNGEYAMAVEVKRRLDDTEDVNHHLKRMELILQYPPAECKGKKLIGAMAGGEVDLDTQKYAHQAGFFVLKLSGDSVFLVDPPAGFTPRQW
jgi:hypothetical protein